MAIGTENVSVLTLIMSSAVISAVVNVGWNALAKWIERRGEAEKEALKVGHVYLTLVLQLEAFARRCNERLYDISIGLDRWRREHDDTALKNLPQLSLVFEPEPDWAVLPIPFVAKVKTLPERFEQCNSWIVMQWQLWADLDDAYELEEERLAFYALQVCKVASEIRMQIKAGDGSLVDLVTHFQSVIDARRKRYGRNAGKGTLIPELKAHFQRDFPAFEETNVGEI